MTTFKITLISLLWFLSGYADASAVKSTEWRNSVLKTAQKSHIRNITISDEGIFGKHRSSVVFFGHIERIPSQNRLYWVMVRVLSEKYGCFMVNKVTDKSKTSFKCRDGRQVVFNYGLTGKVYHFFANQYDRNGQLLVVENRQIVNKVH